MDDSHSSVREKTIQINSSDFIYGTVAEIGAGQETARWFFRTQGASNTLAKAMSAYDMQFSDSIYGREKSGRYVCESRLQHMLNHEFNLLVKRLDERKGAGSCFFAFSNTVAARSRRTGSTGHGWLGIRWQGAPRAEPNEMRIHVKMLDERNIQQQEVLGIMGINLIYSAFFLADHPYKIVEVLGEDIEENRIQVDYISIQGPSVKDHDPKWLNLKLLQCGLAEAVALDPMGRPIQPREYLYGKVVFHYRGSYRPINNLHFELMECAKKEVKNSNLIPPNTTPENLITLPEMYFEEFQDPEDSHFLQEEFFSRQELIQACGLPLLITRFPRYFQLQKFLEDNRVVHSFLIVEAERLHQIFEESHFQDLRGGVLEGIGNLLRPSTHLLVCPALVGDQILDTASFARARPFEKFLNYLLDQKRIISTQCLNKNTLHIQNQSILERLQKGDDSWTSDVPEKIIPLLRRNKLWKK